MALTSRCLENWGELLLFCDSERAMVEEEEEDGAENSMEMSDTGDLMPSVKHAQKIYISVCLLVLVG